MLWSLDTRTVSDIVHTFIQTFGTGAVSVSLPLMGWEGGSVGGGGGGPNIFFWRFLLREYHIDNG
jgi:hypothetical protein